MPYVTSMTRIHAVVAATQIVGNGQCVALVHGVVVIPATPSWRQGAMVLGNSQLAVGTIIATFDSNGRYGNHSNGTSHAAIYLGQTAQGIQVIDQWKGHGMGLDHVPQQRTIHVHRPASKKVDQAEQYYVVQ